MQITERKRAELELKADGLSKRAIAQIVGVDESTVREDMGAGNPALRAANGSNCDTFEGVDAGNPAPDGDIFDTETGERRLCQERGWAMLPWFAICRELGPKGLDLRLKGKLRVYGSRLTMYAIRKSDAKPAAVVELAVAGRRRA